MKLYIEKARFYEEIKKPKDAIDAYIKAFNYKEKMTQDDLLNASVLFFLAQDYGFITTYNIDNKMQLLAWESYTKFLEKAKNSIEANFWKLYIPFVVMGETPFDDNAKKLLELDLTPIIYFISYDQSEKLLNQAKSLIQKHTPAKSERSRYIHSIIDKFI